MFVKLWVAATMDHFLAPGCGIFHKFQVNSRILGIGHPRRGYLGLDQFNQTLTVHHEGHHQGLNLDLGQTPVASFFQPMKTLTFGELPFDLGSFPAGMTRPSWPRSSGNNTRSHPLGFQVIMIALTVIGLIGGSLLGGDRQ